MKLLFCDTETTGLLKPIGAPLHFQPHVIEVCFIQTNEKFEILKKYSKLVNPPIEIPDFIEKLTGITNEDAASAKSFKKQSKKIGKILDESDYFVAHNAPFDYWVLKHEFSRLKNGQPFPKRVCTVEQSMHIVGSRLTLKRLYALATGKIIEGAHRAESDVMALIECYKYLSRER